MTPEEYKEKSRELATEYENKRRELIKQYVKENNPYHPGQIITDHIGSILIERVTPEINHMYGIPYATYYGRILKKDKTPTKRNERRWVHQINLVYDNQ